MSFLTWAHHFFVLLLFSFQCWCVPPIRFSDGEINFSASPWKMSQFLNCCLRTEKEEERRLTGRAVGEDAHLSGQMFCFVFFFVTELWNTDRGKEHSSASVYIIIWVNNNISFSLSFLSLADLDTAVNFHWTTRWFSCFCTSYCWCLTDFSKPTMSHIVHPKDWESRQL